MNYTVLRGGAGIHFKPEKRINPLLKLILAMELVCLILSFYDINLVRYHNFVVSTYKQAYTIIRGDEGGLLGTEAHQIAKEFNERITDEVYEYVWTKEKVSYRKGPDKSYKAAGTLDKDKMVKRTGLTYNKWSRVSIDDNDYYIASKELTDEFPSSIPIASGIKGEYQKYALSLFPDFGWDESELEPLIYLWNRESGWNPNSHNRGSGAHGIPQALPASKMASEGSDYYTNPEPQIRWGLKYIRGRYGSPSRAWASFRSKGWY